MDTKQKLRLKRIKIKHKNPINETILVAAIAVIFILLLGVYLDTEKVYAQFHEYYPVIKTVKQISGLHPFEYNTWDCDVQTLTTLAPLKASGYNVRMKCAFPPTENTSGHCWLQLIIDIETTAGSIAPKNHYNNLTRNQCIYPKEPLPVCNI